MSGGGGSQGGLLLMRELVRLQYGVFEEVMMAPLHPNPSSFFICRLSFIITHLSKVSGFPGDRIYKGEYRIGSETVTTVGCSPAERPSALQFCRW